MTPRRRSTGKRPSEPNVPQPMPPEPRAPEPRAPEPRAPEPRGPESRTPEPRAPEPRASQYSQFTVAAASILEPMYVSFCAHNPFSKSPEQRWMLWTILILAIAVLTAAGFCLLGAVMSGLIPLEDFVLGLYKKGVPAIELNDTWWGPGEPVEEHTKILPYMIHVPEQFLDELHWRLDNIAPFVLSLPATGNTYGINRDLLLRIYDTWRNAYNWREREKFLNQYPQFMIRVQGLLIHYLHVKPEQPEQPEDEYLEDWTLPVYPILLLHGWPGSIREFYEMIPELTSNKNKRVLLEVIAPSLPGFGFSEPPSRPGLDALNMAVLFKNFMNRLGFEEFYVHGGDWGGIIGQLMATLYPNSVIGMHSNFCFSYLHLFHLKRLTWNLPDMIAYQPSKSMDLKKAHTLQELGHVYLQATKPDTIGVALRESPLGLAAYIMERFLVLTNPDWINLRLGGIEKKFGMTKLLDNVMIYWATGSITTSMRLYYETFNWPQLLRSMDVASYTINVPSACPRCLKDVDYPPELYLHYKFRKFIKWGNDSLSCGHFAAFEEPKMMATDIYAFVEYVWKSPYY